MNKFDKWFKAQFGRLPLNPNKHQKMYDQLNNLEIKVARLRSDITDENKLFDQYRAARYAKNAAEMDFDV